MVFGISVHLQTSGPLRSEFATDPWLKIGRTQRLIPRLARLRFHALAMHIERRKRERRNCVRMKKAPRREAQDMFTVIVYDHRVDDLRLV